ncbi:MAG: hypothetical protein NVS1B10_07670 [Candidatus Saccharimonadales bacterium]
MKLDATISSNKVAEIKSRKAPQTDHGSRMKGRVGRFDDGLVKEMKAVVRPRHGGQPLRLTINMDRGSFQKGIILAEFSGNRFLTSVAEFGSAFSLFDPTPIDAMNEKTGKMVSIPKVPKRVTTKVGPVKITGGKTRLKFQEALVTFEMDGQESEFSMRDISSVLRYAL